MRLVDRDNAVTAIRTLMIGSIDRIEQKLGHLWGHERDEEGEFSDDEEEIYELFMDLRESILDFGNEQICKIKGIKWTKR